MADPKLSALLRMMAASPPLPPTIYGPSSDGPGFSASDDLEDDMTTYISADDVKTGAGFHEAATKVAKAKGITFEAAVEELHCQFSATPAEKAEFAARQEQLTSHQIVAMANKLADERDISFEAACEQIEASL